MNEEEKEVIKNVVYRNLKKLKSVTIICGLILFVSGYFILKLIGLAEGTSKTVLIFLTFAFVVAIVILFIFLALKYDILKNEEQKEKMNSKEDE